MAQSIVLPVIDGEGVPHGYDEDLALAKADALDVLRELHKLAFSEYTTWKEALWREAVCLVGEAHDVDDYQWGARQTLQVYEDMLEVRKEAMVRQLHRKRDMAFDDWWEAEKAKVAAGQRRKRPGEQRRSA